MSRVELLKLIPKFKERLFYTADKSKMPYGRQRWKPGAEKPDYATYEEGHITDQLLLSHFSQQVVKAGGVDWSSIAIRWKDKPAVKWICLDFDHDWQIPLREKILTQLSSYGIECLWEVSRSEGDQERSHNWFMLDHVPNKTIERFLAQVWDDLRAQDLPMKENKDWEFYPVFTKKKCLMRLPGGYHFKAGKANGVIVDGKVVEDPVGIIQAFLDLPVYSTEFIESLIKETPAGTIQARDEKRKYTGKFVYLPRNMPAPMPDLPRFVDLISSECQAYRKLIVDAVNNELIDKPGTNYHNAGLVLAKLSRFADHVGDTYPALVDYEKGKGAEWWNILATEYRSRGYKDHEWDARPRENPKANVWTCDTMEEYFGLCEGCPFRKRNNFTSPKQLFFGEQIKRVKVGEVYEA